MEGWSSNAEARKHGSAEAEPQAHSEGWSLITTELVTERDIEVKEGLEKGDRDLLSGFPKTRFKERSLCSTLRARMIEGEKELLYLQGSSDEDRPNQ